MKIFAKRETKFQTWQAILVAGILIIALVLAIVSRLSDTQSQRNAPLAMHARIM